MKKFMMFAAATLLMAGMMVSCNPNGADPKTISGAIKNDIKSVPELVMGKSDADAKKALLDAGFVEGEMPYMAPARATKKAPRKVTMKAEETAYVRTVADGFSEYVACGSADGSVYGVAIAWLKDSVVKNSTFVDAIQQAVLASYDNKACPNFKGYLATEEIEKEYLEGKHTKFVDEMKAELEEMLTTGEITQEMFNEYMAELANLGGCASLVATLKTINYKEYIEVMAEYTDDKAYEFIFNDGTSEEGLYKMVEAEMDVEYGFCGIQFMITKDHLDVR